MALGGRRSRRRPRGQTLLCAEEVRANLICRLQEEDLTAGFSAPSGEIPQSWLSSGLEVERDGRFQALTRRMPVGVLLALHGGEYHVFRAVVFSIVLPLALGPIAELLCQRSCHLQAIAATECPHQESATSPGVVGEDNCDHIVLSVRAFLRGEVRPGEPSPNVGHAVIVPRYHVAQLTTDARTGLEPGREWSLEKRPLSTALRI